MLDAGAVPPPPRLTQEDWIRKPRLNRNMSIADLGMGNQGRRQNPYQASGGVPLYGQQNLRPMAPHYQQPRPRMPNYGPPPGSQSRSRCRRHVIHDTFAFRLPTQRAAPPLPWSAPSTTWTSSDAARSTLQSRTPSEEAAPPSTRFEDLDQ